ncbi:nuclear transport factor 2 family protein [Amycolatopsis sp. H6(2020)]|nr:nuclear transport factor 2 family protein [Amycolatopsis sp. H6(2020)]
MISREDRREAEHQIARLIYTYCHRLDGADLEGAASLFENARWQLSPEIVCHGKAEHLAALKEPIIVYGDKLGTRHMVANLITDVADDGLTAHSMSYVISFQVVEGFPLQPIYQGRYEDTFALTDGEWHFVSRTVHSDGIGDMSHHHKSA